MTGYSCMQCLLEFNGGKARMTTRPTPHNR